MSSFEDASDGATPGEAESEDMLVGSAIFCRLFVFCSLNFADSHGRALRDRCCHRASLVVDCWYFFGLFNSLFHPRNMISFSAVASLNAPLPSPWSMHADDSGQMSVEDRDNLVSLFNFQIIMQMNRYFHNDHSGESRCSVTACVTACVWKRIMFSQLGTSARFVFCGTCAKNSQGKLLRFDCCCCNA
jgi:hypothetical protein